MDKVTEFENVIFAITTTELAVLIQGPPELVKLMDGCFFDDNCNPSTLKKFPAEPGVYQGTIEYWFEQGYSEGYKADGESEWDFVPVNVNKIDVHKVIETMRRWTSANNTMGFPDADQDMWNVALATAGQLDLKQAE